MTLENWNKENRWLKKEESSPEEIADLLSIIDRDLRQATIASVSADWRLSMAFNAALQCALTALRAEGYKLPVVPGHHEKAFITLKYTIGPKVELIEKLQSFRRKRSNVTYDSAGSTSKTEVDELIKHAKTLKIELMHWLKKNHPDLIP